MCLFGVGGWDGGGDGGYGGGGYGGGGCGCGDVLGIMFSVKGQQLG